MQKSLLIFTSYYLPGFKAGGPIRSISSFVSNLNSHFDISVITRNYDIGDRKKCYSITPNSWHITDKYRTLYISFFSFPLFFFLLNKIRVSDYKYIYFNSFFDFKFSIAPVLYLKLINFFGFSSGCKIIIAPRGEFSDSALNNKYFLKFFVIFIYKFFSINKFITWHATSISEMQNINSVFGFNENILCVKNFPSSSLINFNQLSLSNKSDILKVVFVGRVSPMKNLKLAFKILKNVKSNVQYDIYGPIENLDYYNQCKLMVNELPDNINVNFYGEIKHSDVQFTLLNYDLFFSPTLGENYGHAIVESFLVGCPVLISNNTPWRDLEFKKAGFDISLKNIEQFSIIIDYFANMDSITYKKFKNGSYNYGNEISQISDLKNEYLNLFN